MTLPPELRIVLDRPIAYHRCFVTLTGSIEAALMLSQACYWQQRTTSDDDYWYKRRWEWEDEIGLNRYQQEQARVILRSHPWWHEERCGVPAKLHFRVNFGALLDELASKLADRQPKTEGRPTGRQWHSKRTNKSNKTVDGRPANTETPTQIPSETTMDGGDADPVSVLRWPHWLNVHIRTRCLEVLMRMDQDGWTCPPSMYQAAIDVLSAAPRKNKPISSPDGYLLGIIKRIKCNAFVPANPPNITQQSEPTKKSENRAALENERRLLNEELKISLTFADQADSSNQSLAAAHRESAHKKAVRVSEIDRLLAAQSKKNAA